MNLDLILKRLVLCEIAGCAVSLPFAFCDERLPPEELREHANAEAAKVGIASAAMLGFGAVLVFGLFIAAWIGLLRSWRSARLLYTSAWGLGLVLILRSGPEVSSALFSMLVSLSALLGGVILGLIYFSDLRFRFQKPVAPQPPPLP